MAAHEEDVLKARYDAFQEEWKHGQPFRAGVALARFREALERHTRWEEESLFEEFEQRCLTRELADVRRHHRLHEALEYRATRLADLIARLSGAAPSPRDAEELGHAARELADYLAVHRQMELHEVCCRLDAMLPDRDIDMIAEELEERGRPRT